MTFDEAVNKINKLTVENKNLKRKVKSLELILDSTLRRLAENAEEYKNLELEVDAE